MRRRDVLEPLTRAFVIAASLLWASAVAGQEGVRVIRGVVSDSLGRPIPFANVQTTGQSRTVTDDSGHFEYRAPRKGEIALRVTRLGYKPSTLAMTPEGDTSIHIKLAAIPRVLEATHVSAEGASRRLEINGFYGRLIQRHKGLGSGTFFTQEDIARRNPLRITAMLDDVPGVRVKRAGNSLVAWDIRGPNGCEYTVYFDGNRISPPLTESRRSNPLYIDEVLSPSATGGVEVYPRATGAPERFQRLSGTCGVVIFWSR